MGDVRRIVAVAGACFLVAGCTIDPDDNGFASNGTSAGATGGGPAGSSPSGGGTGDETMGGTASDSDDGPGGPVLDVGPGGGGTDPGVDPQTCAEAAIHHTYVGCDFWPTVTYNPVLTNFSFTAAVANGGDEPAEITVERDGVEVATATVAPGSLEKIPLQWVEGLKGPQFNAQTTGDRPNSSIRVDGGAYHLTSSVPVTVWQFNPLEYTDEVANCSLVQQIGLGSSCLSVSNDAALLIPSTAMTGNYRIFLKDSVKGTTGGFDDAPGGAAITATQDGTTVTVHLAEQAQFAAGTGVAAVDPGGTAVFEMDAGDVVQLLGNPGVFWGDVHSDLSGSLVTADAPVQVVGFVPLTSSPSPEIAGEGYADHLEETMLPAEVLGAHYIVAPPSSATGANIGHYVRIYGNFDGTTLEYPGGQPAGAPTTLDAGQVVAFETSEGFEVTGNESFAIGMFVKGGQLHTPNDVPTIGDPAFSLAVAVDQFRSRYIFLAPDDYLVSYADILLPAGATATLDGAPLTGTPQPIDGTSWTLVRELLSKDTGGVHRLVADMADEEDAPGLGLQIMGYGHATGYMVPGGLNLELISAPPPVG
ncbi:MAG: IgGFc-binding protein [Myxococcota bacterium]